MIEKDFEIILEKNNISTLEKLEFNSLNQKINFLNKIEIIKKNQIKIKIINNDIKKIILDLELNLENLKKLQKINWEDFENIMQNNNTLRQKKIYNKFINFIKTELNLIIYEKDLNSKTLINNKKTKLDENQIENLKNKTDLKNILEKNPKFDINQDLKEKCQKYKVKVLFDYLEEGKKTTVQDFVLYFNKRLDYFTKLLENRIDEDNLYRISKLQNINDTNSKVTVIGLISEIKQTKNGHLMITLEDKSGQINCFINKNKLDKNSNFYDKDFAKQVENFCLDEGIGVIGKMGNKIIWTDDIIIPSPPNKSELKKTTNTEYIVCISDTHIGAKVFVDEAFEKFVDWLNCKSSNEQLNQIAKKVKYIIIAGDLIEGIGIYPNQGKDARILSTELQYHKTAQLLSEIPKHICIINICGNHDTNRLSEPQPKLPYDKAYSIYNMENVINLSNPSIVNLFGEDESGGLDLYLYHGGSIFYYADKIQHLREKGGAKAPEEVIKYLLEKRHLAPSHGSTLYLPDSQKDPLVIEKMPDLFITGHTHKMGLANYKGCTIVSCGCWVEMSDYQEKMGMFPDIGKCVIINTRTRKPQILNFYTQKDIKE